MLLNTGIFYSDTDFYPEAFLNSSMNNLFDYVLTENLSEIPNSTNPVVGSLSLYALQN